MHLFLPRYDDIRAAELERMEREDENFVKAVFSKEGDVKVGKLILALVTVVC